MQADSSWVLGPAVTIGVRIKVPQVPQSLVARRIRPLEPPACHKPAAKRSATAGVARVIIACEAQDSWAAQPEAPLAEEHHRLAQ